MVAWKWRPPAYAACLPVLFFVTLSTTALSPILTPAQKLAFGDALYITVGVWDAVAGVLAFLAAPVLGSIADRVGRVGPLIFVTLFLALPKVLWLFSGSVSLYTIVSGCVGFADVVLSLALAYTADLTPPHARTSAYGVVMASLGAGIILGPAIALPLFSTFSDVGVLVFSSITGVLAPIFTIVFLRQRESRREKSKFDYTLLNPFRVFFSIGKSAPLRLLMFIVFFATICSDSLLTLLTRYMTFRFDFDALKLVLTAEIFGLSYMLVQIFLVPVMIRKKGELTTMKIGTIISATVIALFSAANQVWMLFALVLIDFPAFVVFTASSGAVSRYEPDETRQGEVLGAVGGIRQIAAALGPLAFGTMLTVAEHSSLPGWPFLVLSGCTLLSFVCMFFLPATPPIYARAAEQDDDGDVHENSEPFEPPTLPSDNSAINVDTKDTPLLEA